MFTRTVVVFLLFTIYCQDSITYYVDAVSGSDTSDCGAKSTPCVSINKVITNYPDSSYTVSIAGGTYPTNQINFRNSVIIIFQGTGNTSITANWSAGSFISNSQISSLEFHDLALTLSGVGSDFLTLSGVGNTAGFYNIILSYVEFTSGNFINVNGGSLIINNLTLTKAVFDSTFIYDVSKGDNSNISLTGSTFSNLTILQKGGLFVFNGYGAANILIDSTTFDNIRADYVFIGFWAADVNQTIIISNNIFNNTKSYLPCVYMENDYQCVINIQNTTWNNATADFVSGALETLGSNNGQDHNITLNSLRFSNCKGNYTGGVFVAYNSLVLSNSVFTNNSNSAGYANDVVQGLDSKSSNFKYFITNSFSLSSLPKAIVWDHSSGSILDISDALPDHSRDVAVGHLDRRDISALPKFGHNRKQEKNTM